jgi:hypothetical protein
MLEVSMQTKLTLRMDDGLIRRAKAYASRTGKSVSQMVADYFAVLEATAEDGDEWMSTLSPAVRSLLGVAGGQAVTEADYGAYLDEKHQ